MRSRVLGILLVSFVLAAPILGQEGLSSRLEDLVDPFPETDTGCPDEPCGCRQGDPIDLLQYFIPSYPGWQTAKKHWLYMGGGTTQFRFFQYGTYKYELIKCGDGRCTETFTAGLGGVYVTSEIGTVLGAQDRRFDGQGLYFLPATVCPNRRTFRPCDQGQTFINRTSCLPTSSLPPHCAIYLARVDFAPGWDFGYDVGVVDSIISIGKLDNGETEKYWYGLNRGLLRWEHWSAQGQLLNWAQETGITPNSPIPHNTCLQP